MTKKHFIALADIVRLEILPNIPDAETREMIVRELARFCKSQNGNFNAGRWADYIDGKCGPNGGKIS